MARVLAARAIVTVAGELTPPELTIGHVVNAHAEITTAPYAANTRYLANSELRRTLLQLQAHGAPYGLRDSVPRLARPAPRPVTVDADTIGNILSLATPFAPPHPRPRLRRARPGQRRAPRRSTAPAQRHRHGR
jgi:hypothetical protein